MAGASSPGISPRRLGEAATPKTCQSHKNGNDEGIGEKAGQGACPSEHARLAENKERKGKRDDDGAEDQAKMANGSIVGKPRQPEDDAKDHDPSRIERLSCNDSQ